LHQQKIKRAQLEARDKQNEKDELEKILLAEKFAKRRHENMEKNHINF
jgi:hypothetical protein